MPIRRSSSRSAPARRKLVWARWFSAPLVSPVVGTAQTFFPLDTFETAYGAQLIGCTVMRIRGTITAKRVNNSANGQLVWAVKVADLPGVNPEAPASTGINDDWFMYETWCGVEGAVAADQPIIIQERRIDVRSRRKLDELGQRLAISVEATGTATSQWATSAALSFLIALP